jgi:hypothetical protein
MSMEVMLAIFDFLTLKFFSSWAANGIVIFDPVTQ